MQEKRGDRGPLGPSPKSAYDFKKGMFTTQMSGVITMRTEKVYVPDEDSLEQKINIFHGQLYSLYSQGERESQISSSPSAPFLIKSRSDS